MKNLPIVDIPKMNCSECIRINTDCPKITQTGYCQFNDENEWPDDPDGD